MLRAGQGLKVCYAVLFVNSRPGGRLSPFPSGRSRRRGRGAGTNVCPKGSTFGFKLSVIRLGCREGRTYGGRRGPERWGWSQALLERSRPGPCMPQHLPAWTLVAVEALRLYHSLVPAAPTEASSCRKVVEEATEAWKDLTCPAVFQPRCPECPVCPEVAERTLGEIWLPRCVWAAVSLHALVAAAGRWCQRRYAPPPRRGRGVVDYT